MGKRLTIKDLQNKHNNEIIFIVGAGPSINNIDVDLLKNYTVMAVNSGILAAPFAKYFTSDDTDIMSWNYFNDLEKMNCICLFFEKKWRDVDVKFLSEERVVFYDHKSWFSPPSSYNLPDGLILTKDINDPIIGGRTSTGSCVHLAYCMGAKVIVLLGNDCKLSKDKHHRYFWQDWPIDNQPFRISGYEFNSRNQNRGFNRDSLIKYWNKFAEVNRKIIGEQVEIIDCSDSDLRCFTRMHLQEIIDKYG